MPQLLPYEMAWRAGLDAPRPGGPIPPSQAIADLRAARPDLAPPFLANVFLPGGEFAHYAWFVPNPKDPDDFHAILVDPNSGRYRGERSLSGFTVGWIVNAHTSLLKGAPGRIATAALSTFALLTLVTGTWMWWPKTRGQLRQRLRVKWGWASSASSTTSTT